MLAGLAKHWSADRGWHEAGHETLLDFQWLLRLTSLILSACHLEVVSEHLDGQGFPWDKEVDGGANEESWSWDTSKLLKKLCRVIRASDVNDLLWTHVKSDGLIDLLTFKVWNPKAAVLNLLNVQKLCLSFATKQLESRNVVIENMSLQMYLMNCFYAYIDRVCLAEGVDRLYRPVYIFIIDVIFHHSNFKRFALKVIFRFFFAHASLSFLQILAVAFHNFYGQISKNSIELESLNIYLVKVLDAFPLKIIFLLEGYIEIIKDIFSAVFEL